MATSTSSKDKDRQFIDTVMKNLKMAVDAEEHNRVQSIEDLRFLNGDQWDEDEKKRRKRRKRPMLTINMLPEKVDKVVGDMRQNRARVKVRPASSDANPELARIREGMIMKIEYKSNAAAIYDYAGGRMVECGEGAWRVLTRYCEDNPFVQEIYLKLIKNSFLVYLDPKAEGPMREDAKWGIIATKMKREDFKEQFPKATPPVDNMKWGQGLGSEQWYDSDTVTVAEYFYMEKVKKTMCLMSTGEVMEEKEAQKLIKEWEEKYETTPEEPQEGSLVTGMTPPPVAPPPMPGVPAPPISPMPMASAPTVAPFAPPKPEVKKKKEVEVERIKYKKLTACDVLEGPKDVPGKYIPIVKIRGKERNVEGKDYVRGLVRDGKDPQRLVNYWNTSTAEYIALAPKSPWQGTAKMFEGYEEDYANANVDNIPFLKSNPDPDMPGTMPQRRGPGEPPIALFTQVQNAERNLNTVLGTGPDLRDVAPDASAKSLIQRQKPHELSTFVFIDNLAQGQLYTYKIINEMIPEVYDTERDVEMRQLDGAETFVPINMRAEDALKMLENNPRRYSGMDISKLRESILRNGGDSRFNDIGIGKYDIQVDLGPSFATQRQETADKFVMLAQTNPALWKIAGDLIVESLDVNKATELAERLRKTLPPGLVKPRAGEPPTPPPPVSPQMQLMVEKAKTERARQEKEKIKQQVELIRLKTELVRQYKETKATDTEIRKQILKALMELHSPQHPADAKMAQMVGGGGGENTTGGMEQ